MAYNSDKGPQHSGDIQFEEDPNETKIDFEVGYIAFKTHGQTNIPLIISGATFASTVITASTHLSCSRSITASSFVGDGASLSNVLTGTAGSNEVLYGYGGNMESNYQLKFQPDLERASVVNRHSRLELSGALVIYGATASAATLSYATEAPLLYADYLNRTVGINISGSEMNSAVFNMLDSGSSAAAFAARPRFAIIKSASSYGQAFTQDDHVGEIAFGGTSGSGDTPQPNFRIRAEVDGTTWTSTSRPTRMSFYVTPSGSTMASINDSTNFALTVNSSGNVGVGEKFPSASMHISTSHLVGVSDRTALMVSGTTIFSGTVAIGTGAAGGGGGAQYDLHINSPAGKSAAVCIDAHSGNQAQLTFAATTELGKISATEVQSRPYLTITAGSEVKGEPGVFRIRMQDNDEGVEGDVLRINSYDGASTFGALTASVPMRVSGEVIATALETAASVINTTHVSSSLNISGAAFYGDGAGLTGLTPVVITTYSNATDNRVITSVNSTSVQGEANLTFDGLDLSVVGNVTASQGVTGSSLRTAATVIDSTHVSSSLNISGAAFYGDGANLTGLTPAAITTLNSAGSNRVITSDGGTTATGEANLTFDGTQLAITGDVSASSTLQAVGATTLGSTLSVSGAVTATGTLAATVANNPVAQFTHPSDNATGAVLELINSRAGNAGQADDFCGGVVFKSKDSTSAATQYSKISTKIGSPTNTSEAGYMLFEVTTGGTAATTYLRLDGGTNALTSSVDTKMEADLNVAGTIDVGTGIDSNAKLSVSGSDNSTLAIFQTDGYPLIMGITGSGKVAVGGLHLDAKLNVSGSDLDKLFSIKGDARDPTFYVSGSGEAFISGNLIMQNVEPTIYFSGSNGSTVLGQIGYNATDNILIQNNVINKHIVFKANDNGTIREGLRLNGAVPEVVVNESPESMINFRVESSTNAHMLFVTGSNQVGIGVSDPAIGVTLDISGSAMRLRNSSTPASAGAPGVAGEIRWDANYIYICIATDNWKRAAIAGGW
jgi:hypothetical protein